MPDMACKGVVHGEVVKHMEVGAEQVGGEPRGFEDGLGERAANLVEALHEVSRTPRKVQALTFKKFKKNGSGVARLLGTLARDASEHLL